MSLLLQLPLIVGCRQLLFAPFLKRQRAQNSRFAHERAPFRRGPEQLLSSKHLHSLYFAAFKFSCLFERRGLPAVATHRWVCVTTESHVLPALCCVCYFRPVMSCLTHFHCP